MRISLYELDLWALRGFGGVLRILEQRLRQACGFGQHAQSLAEITRRRFNEVCDEIASRPEKHYPETETTIASVDKWFVDGLNGINNHLATRIKEGPPLSSENVETLKHELRRLKEAIERCS